MVDTVYETLLGRPAEGDGRDQARRDYWRNALDQGDITSVGVSGRRGAFHGISTTPPSLNWGKLTFQWAAENADGVSIARAMNDQSALGP